MVCSRFAVLSSDGHNFKTQDQGVNERTWTIVDLFDLYVLDFLNAGGLWPPIERCALVSLFMQAHTLTLPK